MNSDTQEESNEEMEEMGGTDTTYGYHIMGPVSRATAVLRPTYLAPKLCFPTPC
jgi:hypothetical protein